MSSGILGEVYQITYDKPTIRQRPFEVWVDIFIYARNLKGNWLKSEEIFNNCIAPTAMQHPEYYAECVEEMVKKSGVKIRYRSSFLRAVKAMKNFKTRNLEPEIIKRALTDMFNAGLYEPLYAERAIRALAAS